MEQDSQSLALPARLDAGAARRLVAELADWRGRNLQIDAGDVEIVSALSLELLLSAALQCGRDGVEFCIGAASAPFVAACRTLGLEDGSLVPGPATGIEARNQA